MKQYIIITGAIFLVVLFNENSFLIQKQYKIGNVVGGIILNFFLGAIAFLIAAGVEFVVGFFIEEPLAGNIGMIAGAGLVLAVVTGMIELPYIGYTGGDEDYQNDGRVRVRP